jgi:putative membrane protein
MTRRKRRRGDIVVAKILYLLVILIHVYIVVLEMVLWKQRAARVFRMPQALVVQTASLASNQGLYNLFLVAALVLGWALPDPALAAAFALYGLGCVAVAGLWGAFTVSPRIALVQTVPAVLALAARYLA